MYRPIGKNIHVNIHKHKYALLFYLYHLYIYMCMNISYTSAEPMNSTGTAGTLMLEQISIVILHVVGMQVGLTTPSVTKSILDSNIGSLTSIYI